MAGDLREIVSSLKISADLERIGDYAANIAKRSMVLAQFHNVQLVAPIPRMGRLVQEIMKDILDAYKKRKGDWSVYEKVFLELMARREVEKKINPELLKQGCLLCSEHLPHQCHRRLVAEYLNVKWGGIETTHLV